MGLGRGGGGILLLLALLGGTFLETIFLVEGYHLFVFHLWLFSVDW
jgi:hypothetical protein